jgi:hypothetical protein
VLADVIPALQELAGCRVGSDDIRLNSTLAIAAQRSQLGETQCMAQSSESNGSKLRTCSWNRCQKFLAGSRV